METKIVILTDIVLVVWIRDKGVTMNSDELVE